MKRLCRDPATHTVTVKRPDGTAQSWQLCRRHEKAKKIEVVNRIPPKPPDPPQQGTSHEVECRGCHRALAELPSLSHDERTPCPDCGSLERQHNANLQIAVSFHASSTVTATAPGRTGWARKIKAGDDFGRRVQAWGTYSQVRDRVTDAYEEVITLYDGTVIESHAKLTDHW